MREEMSEQWHMSKSFNLSFLFGVLVQTCIIVWFMAGLDSSVRHNANELIRQETRIESLEATAKDQAIAIARIDENIKAIREMMEAQRK